MVGHVGPWGHEGDMGNMETSGIMEGMRVGIILRGGIGDMEGGIRIWEDMETALV